MRAKQTLRGTLSDLISRSYLPSRYRTLFYLHSLTNQSINDPSKRPSGLSRSTKILVGEPVDRGHRAPTSSFSSSFCNSIFNLVRGSITLSLPKSPKSRLVSGTLIGEANFHGVENRHRWLPASFEHDLIWILGGVTVTADIILQVMSTILR